MARLLSTLLVVGLLAGTAAAFAVTENLKLQKSTVYRTSVPLPVFSPVCDCPTDTALIQFALRKPETVTLTMLDSHGDPVRTIVEGKSFRSGPKITFKWNGRDDAGRVVPDGEYRPRVHLAREHQTITLPNPIDVDTVPPKVTSFTIPRPVVSPDGDLRHDSVAIRYELDGPARALLYVNDRRVILTLHRPVKGVLRWSATRNGRPLPAGVYKLTMSARDPAGNLAPRTGVRPVVVRYITLPQDRIEVKAGKRFSVFVRTDASGYRWQLGRKHGFASHKLLVLRAPKQKGGYRLVVNERGHSDSMAVIVRKRK